MRAWATDASTEALYRAQAACRPEAALAARDALEMRPYPIREIETLSKGKEGVERTAMRAPTTADAADLDIIATHLQRYDAFVIATWTASSGS